MEQTSVEIMDVDATNVAELGFFCHKSKSKGEGYQKKLAWLDQRFREGLQLKIVYEDGRSVGFIEYVPGEFGWRAVQAEDYMLIHCIWVVGRAKEKGYASRLLEMCIEDARRKHKRGVVMVTRTGGYLAGKKLFLKYGFELVDEAPPAFELMVNRFDDGSLPAFPNDWEARLEGYGPGLTIFSSGQCPYLHDSVNMILDVANELGIPAQVVELESPQQVQSQAPSPYGIFNLIRDGRLLSFRPPTRNELLKLLATE